MSEFDSDELQKIFAEASEYEPGAARIEFVKQVCGKNMELFDEVIALLSARDEADTFLEHPDFSDANLQDFVLSDNLAGKKIGPYQLEEQIGEGGFGVVYKAHQSQPIDRDVAIKLIKPGMDTRDIVARFEAERNSLAKMDHPNIARIIDGGVTDSGIPFFVMDYVQGSSIVEYCDDHQLTTAERLNLFAQVCDGVHHAHQKGIIHRDLKPSNVLIAGSGIEATAKIIDFGIAKITHPDDDIDSPRTRGGQVLGTPMYMSPEQAGTMVGTVDARSDIYSLGVILFELLTATTPVTKQKFQSSKFDDILQYIREADTPKPSSRISDEFSDVNAIAAKRKTRPTKLARALRGEIDWIVLKALDKNPNRRYDSAAAFAKDIQRYLANQPIEASPPSWTYRASKFVVANRTLITIVAGFMLLLSVATVISIVQANRAREKELAASEALLEQKQATARAIELQKLSTRLWQSEKKERESFDGLWKFTRNTMLSPVFSGPQFYHETEMALDEKALEAANTFRELPAAQVRVYAMLSDSFAWIGKGQKAIEMQKRAFEASKKAYGETHQNTIVAKLNVAKYHSVFGDNDAAQQWLPATDEIDDTTLDGKARKIEAMRIEVQMLFDRSKREEANKKAGELVQLAIANLGDWHLTSASCHRLYASILMSNGQYEQAKIQGESALRIQVAHSGYRSTLVADTLEFLALIDANLKMYQRAIGLAHIAQVTKTAQLPTWHPDYVKAKIIYGDVLWAGNLVPEAINEYRRAMELAESEEFSRGDADQRRRNTIAIHDRLGVVYFCTGKYQQAVEEHRKVIDYATRYSMEFHPLGLRGRAKLAIALFANQQNVAADNEITRLLNDDMLKLPGDFSIHQSLFESTLQALEKSGDHRMAIRLLTHMINFFEVNNGIDQLDLIELYHRLGGRYLATNDRERAGKYAEKAYRIRLGTLGENHRDTLKSSFLLAQIDHANDNLSEAISRYKPVYQRQVEHLGAIDVDTMSTLQAWVQCLRLNGDSKDSFIVMELAIDHRIAAVGVDDARSRTLISDLIQTYNREGLYPDAVALLKKVIDASEHFDGSDNNNIFEYQFQLATFYQNMCETEKAAQQYQEVIEHFDDPTFRHALFAVRARTYLACLYSDSLNAHPNVRQLKEYVDEVYASGANMFVFARLDAIANSYREKGRYHSALEIRKLACDYCLKDPQSDTFLPHTQYIYGRELVYAASNNKNISPALVNQFLAQAEGYFLNCAENARRLPMAPPPFSTDMKPMAAEALIELYRATGETEKQKKWETKLREMNARL